MLEIEMAVVGSLLIWREELSHTIAVIDETDFISPECREIFEVIRSKPNVKDLTLILAELSEEATVVAVQAAQTYANSLSSFNTYLAKLKEQGNSRRIKNRLYSVIMDPKETVTADFLREVAGEEQNTVIDSYAKQSKEHLKGFAQRATSPVAKILTGWNTLDNIIGGLRVPAVSIVGALPSTGKTSFALNITHKQMLEAKKIVVFSLEMSSDMIYERLACIFMNLDYQLFNNRNFSPKDKADLEKFGEMLGYMNLYVFDNVYDVETQGMIINQIKPDFVVVDYVQKVSSKHKGESRRTEIEYISGQYKQIANRCNCHIMLLSQLTRGSDSTPSMRNLKESGALEADGDYVMILNRPYVYNKKEYEPNETTLLVDKNKFGSTGMMDMSFEGKHQKFYEETDFEE